MLVGGPNLENRISPTTPLVGGRIAFVGQAPRESDFKAGRNFSGNSGAELYAQCAKAGIAVEECYFTNVFDFKIPGNYIASICGKKGDVGGADYTHAPLSSGKYVKPEFLDSLQRLQNELDEWKPNVVVALGDVALWALCGHAKVGTYRGAVAESTLVPGLKIIHIVRNGLIMLMLLKK